MSKSTENFRITNPIHFLALGFGSGLLPKAPGTYGTLAAIPLYLLLAPTSVSTYLAIVIIMSIAGIYICGKAAEDAGVPDHGAIVWDEIVGFLITMFLVPLTWQSIVVGFILFRIFDIFKPWPISYVDKNLHGGLGIMVDDILAGLAALACMHLIF
ncbi:MULTISPECIES: phosphatidylglycerophosphatase A [unclassified Colwellia]|jgi:phosphatidylglycerophosphatase A|uniref:phosphatidylglycerophosphatase A family protein n=1 Tax=unclassified Colwellia TaxID=196834 RepID=UPI0015F63713|nr:MULTISPECIES: phosphatidylglycerophosphatase A [unclassified Colwellia]MBA6335707.1 phosphatidylglycerophosphatase A [Colwellia sp. BRX8-7]MBA6350930.1 phosphatidylglycerophosphatase A [Colwellia sp. BRX9-1]MBA6354546.1 phosphatidylglycerophosphatase A [Colwellia sp. BRX8-3]MBA6358187.1 phosphatidylglycerophosphatase A [Colwellia sp. BRX8-6]MBA6366060.1 phosphatidylglycerophosphatase A [Colwellia sp. BRX8-5]|tara:strand:- start:3233 stop:3700 length:468 start_codon:yes stop_codon:yes gene_type:complete